ncbi:hypothetical protein AUJ84_00155 [Candidatus Pacearchaeota archaeon CG1_02_32_132]|nr:MAG: hypothetical protein AUJ84_00155 [Candidatus Pacearchaeota archaeon CG1_02_32_132]
MSEKEERIRSITSMYYSNPRVQKALFDFAKNREIVLRYFEGFGKRPDSLQYPSDILAAVKKGATSFHASEEIWRDPMQLNLDLSPKELISLRESWDLLIDVDSPYLDSSKLATALLIKTLEENGIKHYAIKFSGSKGFHILVPGKAFPDEFQEVKKNQAFPEWPRAICQFLMNEIKPEYNRLISKWDINFKALEERTNISREEITELRCPNCNKTSKKGNIVKLQCERCKNFLERPNLKVTKRKLKCADPSCPGFYNVLNDKEYFFCEACGYSSQDKTQSPTRNSVTNTSEAKKSKYSEEFKEEVSGEMIGSLDLVLVAPRHLFRMPYSLHEKTTLASIVLTKDEIQGFNPRDADPFKVKVRSFYPEAEKDEALSLLQKALKWKKLTDTRYEDEITKKYSSQEYQELDLSNITEHDFPKTIKTLLKGLQDGRKRGLFILITFLRSINYPPEKVNNICREWNKKNNPPLKEGYLKSQIDWHLKQKRKILPPNYSNQNFYKDLKLFDVKPEAKNPISEVSKKVRNK